MNKTEHLLIILSEECAELTKNVSKSLRFGLDSSYLPQDVSNREKIIAEFNDIYAVMLMLHEEGVFQGKSFLTGEAIENKKERVLKFMEWSKDIGTLT